MKIIHFGRDSGSPLVRSPTSHPLRCVILRYNGTVWRAAFLSHRPYQFLVFRLGLHTCASQFSVYVHRILAVTPEIVIENTF